ncbi:MAG: helix-turn-helix domain-containing protein [Anaeromyxobacter sp.]|nr:helix-turn-helix domain-containing protein [Anaeromyxobacter sp.]MBL0276254.1 helix-turn-helix domain-containing protein [Anaeromyxobacter sp.]
MTVKDVGALLSKSNQAVHKMIERGQLPGVTRVGRRVYVRRADLLRSLAEGRVPSPGRSR